MTKMLRASLLINVLILVPVCFGLLVNLEWTTPVYGAPTDARAILLSVYLSILICSIALQVVSSPTMTASLLCVQIVYKVLTVFIVGLANPVAFCNLLVAAFHSVGLYHYSRSNSAI